MQALHSVSYPTPLGCQIMQRAGKWDAQEVPQLGSAGTKRYCRSEVASFQIVIQVPSQKPSVAMWGCAAEALTATVSLFTYRK